MLPKAGTYGTCDRASVSGHPGREPGGDHYLCALRDGPETSTGSCVGAVETRSEAQTLSALHLRKGSVHVRMSSGAAPGPNS